MDTSQGRSPVKITVNKATVHIGFPDKQTPLWLQVTVPKDQESDVCNMASLIVKKLQSTKIWEDDQLERLFWNFARLLHLQPDRGRSTQDFVDPKLRDIRDVVQRTPAAQIERTPLEFRRSAFPDVNTATIEEMSRALNRHDMNVILKFGPKCLEMQESVKGRKEGVRAWMRRACVLAVLGIQKFDNLVVESAIYSAAWEEKMNKVVEAYKISLAKAEESFKADFQRAVGQFRNLGPYIKLSKPRGNLYEMTDSRGVRNVAVKTLQYSSDNEYKNMRDTLVWNTSDSYHVGVHRILGVYYIGSYPALVSDWCSGGNAIQHIKAIVDNNDSDSVLRRILQIIRQVLESLQQFHAKNVAHGNLKGSNVLRGEDKSFKLSDFGLARTNRAHKLPIASRDAVQFMSPERLQRTSGPSPADDMWAVSCIFVQLASRGGSPYGNLSLSTADLVARICNGTLRPLRPPSVSEVVWRPFETNLNVDPKARLTAEQTLWYIRSKMQ